jgi:2,4-dienoyl-CoA reductase (NADPH2)
MSDLSVSAPSNPIAPNAPGIALFPTLLSPLVVGTHRLANRTLMGSMHTRLETLDRSIERLSMFYAERARGGAALIATGGFSPNAEGLIETGSPVLDTVEHAEALRPITRAVHDAGGKFLLQILHAGRYAKIPGLVGASPIPSRINPRVPRALSTDEVWRTIEDYVRCAELARHAGFDGVEVMGSEGYLINQFTVTRTNDRTDLFGGSLENRHRFAVEIVRRIRARLGPECLLMFRVSTLDLVEGGATAEEVAALARAVEAAGADILNTGVGWHEASIPTISHVVPRAAWRFAAARIKRAVSIPVIVSNRINTPELAEQILASGDADMVSMARPFLADADFVRKAAEARPEAINTCIACNQACLDFILRDRSVACLVNPRAGRELEFSSVPTRTAPRKVAVVGAGAAGMSCAIAAAERGHAVTLFESQDDIGGQLNYARAVPDKQEFDELMRYFRQGLERSGVHLVVKTRASAQHLRAERYDRIVVATGVLPRKPSIDGIEHPMVHSYADVLSRRVQAGRRVAVLGAGGIGFDVSVFLLNEASPPGAAAHHSTAESFFAEWGVDTSPASAGGVVPPCVIAASREVTLLQRKPEKPGRTLGPSTGWTIKAELARRDLRTLSGVTYDRIDDAGLHVTVGGQARLLAVDSIVVCTGQTSDNALAGELRALGIAHDVIGGADYAAELDALRAIEQGTRLALAI